MKKIIPLLTLIFAFSLMSCSEAKKVTEEQVLESLKSNDFVEETSVSVETFTIESRELSDDKKTETITSELIFKSALAEFTAQFTTTCSKGEDGWYIVDSEIEDYDYKALAGPSDQEIFAAVDKLKTGELRKSGLSLGGKSLSDSEIDFDNNAAQFIVDIEYVDPYVTESGLVYVYAEFDYESGWIFDITDYEVTRQWLAREATYVLKFTSLRANDDDIVNLNGIYFTGEFIETYSIGGIREENDQIYVKLENGEYSWRGITKEDDYYETNHFNLKFGNSSSDYYLIFITYNYEKQEFRAETPSGSSGYFKIGS